MTISNNRRVYRTIRKAILQLYPGEPKGRTAQMLTTLAALVSGILMRKSCQLPTIAKKTPDRATPDSRIKRYSRWIQNERVDYDVYYLPFFQELLYRLAEIRELVFIMDGSEVGHGCITLMIAACLAYLWIIYLGLTALREDWVRLIHRADRCDWSLFHLGLALLGYFLNEELSITVSFTLLEPISVR